MNTLGQIRSSRGSFTRGRRDFVSVIALGFGVLSLPWSMGQRVLAGQPEATVERAANLVVTENRKPGATDWQLTRVRADRDGFRSPWIEGYCSKQSVRAGETIDIMVSTQPPRRFRIEMFRMGYYGGRGARAVSCWPGV